MVFTEPDMELHYDTNCQERNRFQNIVPYKQNCEPVRVKKTKKNWLLKLKERIF